MRVLTTILTIFLSVSLLLAPVLADETKNLSVTTVIDPRITDATTSLSADKNMSSGDTTTVTITYTSILTSQTPPLSLTANWSKGLIEGTNVNYIDLFDYIDGSASTSSDGTAPVIDTTNNQVIWNINNLPTNSTHTVTFKLRARADLPTDKNVTATLSLNSVLNNTLTLDKQTQTITVKPSSTTTASTSTTPTPTPSTAIASPLSISSVEIPEIANTSAKIRLSFSRNASYTVSYGASPATLTQRVQNLTPVDVATVDLADLSANSAYYFTINAHDNAGNSVTSSVFTFTTAKEAQSVPVTKENVSLSSNAIPVTSSSTDSVVLPVEKPLSIAIKLDQSVKVTKVIGKFVNAQVLGITSSSTPESIEETAFVEILPGIFTGQVKTPQKAGYYRMVLQISDVSGGFYTKSLPYSIFVSNPITFIDATTREPLEGVRVKVFQYQSNTQQFLPLEQGVSLLNRTNEKGQLDIVLPAGTYIVEAVNLGYKTSRTRFELGGSDLSYPQVALEPSNTLGDRIGFYLDSTNAVIQYFLNGAQNFFVSRLAKNTIMVFAQLVILFLFFILFSVQMHLGALGLPLHLLEALHTPLRRLIVGKEAFFQLYVYDDQHMHRPVTGAHVQIFDKEGHLVYTQKTNALGKVEMPQTISRSITLPGKVVLYRRGYTAEPVTYTKTLFENQVVRFEMKRQHTKSQNFFEFVDWFVDISFIMITDLLVWLLFIFALLFTYFQGLRNSYPFLIESVVMFLIWMVYIKDMWALHKQETL